MKSTLMICSILFCLVLSSSGLVHLIFLEKIKGKPGCKGPKGDLGVGDEVADDLTCGVLMCLDAQGTAMYKFCQKPVTFATCDSSETINRKKPFPECCWQCVHGVEC